MTVASSGFASPRRGLAISLSGRRWPSRQWAICWSHCRMRSSWSWPRGSRPSSVLSSWPRCRALQSNTQRQNCHADPPAANLSAPVLPPSWGGGTGADRVAAGGAAGPFCRGVVLCRARHLGQLESTLEGREPLGHDHELLIRQWLQQMAHCLLGQRRPLSEMARPLRGDAKPDEATVMGIAVFADNPLGGEAAHEDRYPALGQTGQPRDPVDSDAAMLGDLLEQGQARTGHRKRQPTITGQLDILPAELSLHATQQGEDVLLSLRASRPPSTSFSRAARTQAQEHVFTLLR